MLDFTFLKEDQIWGDDALEVMKFYGMKVAPTDLTVILGGLMTHDDYHRTSEGDLTCASWSASSSEIGSVRCVFYKGDKFLYKTDGRIITARPALPPSEASKISPSEARVIDGIRVAEYGEYPQTVADERTGEKLERLRGSRYLRPTGKNYTFDSVEEYRKPFKATAYPEYEMDGKRYIRVLGRPADHHSKLSTGNQVRNGKPYWVEVQPIEWLMDPSGTMVAKKCLFAGIQFDTKKKYDGDFSKTFMKHYLDTYFAKEMEPLEMEKSRAKTKTASDAKTKTSSDAKTKTSLDLDQKSKILDKSTKSIRSYRQKMEKMSKEGKLPLCKEDKRELFQKIHDIEHAKRARMNLLLYKQQKKQK